MCVSTQPCPPCWQPGCQPAIQRDSVSQSLTQAAQEELRKFLGKQRSLEVNLSSKSPRGSWMWELWVFRCGSRLGYQQCSFWIHPGMVLRAPQGSPVPQVLSSVTNPAIFPPTSKTKMPISPSDGDREQRYHQQKRRIRPGTSSLKYLILFRQPAATDLQNLEELWIPWMF